MFKHYENTKTKREKNAARFSWVIDTNFPLNHSKPANSLVSILKLFFLFLFRSHSLSVYLLGTIHKYFEPDNGLFSLVCLACISTHTHTWQSALDVIVYAPLALSPQLLSSTSLSFSLYKCEHEYSGIDWKSVLFLFRSCFIFIALLLLQFSINWI